MRGVGGLGGDAREEEGAATLSKAIGRKTGLGFLEVVCRFVGDRAQHAAVQAKVGKFAVTECAEFVQRLAVKAVLCRAFDNRVEEGGKTSIADGGGNRHVTHWYRPFSWWSCIPLRQKIDIPQHQTMAVSAMPLCSNHIGNAALTIEKQSKF